MSDWKYIAKKIKVDSFEKSSLIDGNVESLVAESINWEIIPEFRSWGIKSLRPSVRDQIVTFDVEFEDKNGDYYNKLIELKLEDVVVDINLNGDGDSQSLQYCLESISFYSGKWTAEFSIST